LAKVGSKSIEQMFGLEFRLGPSHADEVNFGLGLSTHSVLRLRTWQNLTLHNLDTSAVR